MKARWETVLRAPDEEGGEGGGGTEDTGTQDGEAAIADGDESLEALISEATAGIEQSADERDATEADDAQASDDEDDAGDEAKAKADEEAAQRRGRGKKGRSRLDDLVEQRAKRREAEERESKEREGRLAAESRAAAAEEKWELVKQLRNEGKYDEAMKVALEEDFNTVARKVAKNQTQRNPEVEAVRSELDQVKQELANARKAAEEAQQQAQAQQAENADRAELAVAFSELEGEESQRIVNAMKASEPVREKFLRDVQHFVKQGKHPEEAAHLVLDNLESAMKAMGELTGSPAPQAGDSRQPGAESKPGEETETPPTGGKPKQAKRKPARKTNLPRRTTAEAGTAKDDVDLSDMSDFVKYGSAFIDKASRVRQAGE